MKENEIYIESLVHKFFEGKTSNMEEKELWLYFSSDEIPSELQEYQDLFRYFGGEFIEDLKRETLPVQFVPLRKRELMKTVWIILSSVAAALILLMVSPHFNGFDPYEGSYMITNGNKFYNTKLIKEQEREIRKMAAEREREYSNIYEQSEIKTNEIRDIQMAKINKLNI